MISVELLTTLVSSCLRVSSMSRWERSEDPATSWAWSTCSRRRWPETATTPMASSSRLSWPMTRAEIDDIFNEFEVDEDYMVKTKEVVGLFVAVKEEEKKEEKKEEAPVEAPAEEDEGDAKKKKKKKKKAAK